MNQAQLINQTGRRRDYPGYGSWHNMVRRCTAANHKNWKDYGGRGIRVHPAWLGKDGFSRFMEYMGPRPNGATIDRFPDNDGHYEPGNVRWATRAEQAQNRRSTKLTVADAAAIRSVYFAGGISLRKLAAQYRVTLRNIACIVKGITWKATN